MAYLQNWLKWLNCSSKLKFSGCESKKQWAICNGIHDALIQQIGLVAPTVSTFYTIHGDYSYYDLILQGKNHIKIFPEQINQMKDQAYLIVSIPHHSGQIPSWFATLTEICIQRKIRVFLDCAFFGTIQFGIVDTSLSCWDAVAFSISKAFHAGGCRIGIVFGDNLPRTMTEPLNPNFNYWNINGVNIANAILTKFQANFMPNLCRSAQVKVCKELGFEPCDVFMLGVSQNENHSYLKRPGTNFNRICVTDLIVSEMEF